MKNFNTTTAQNSPSYNQKKRTYVKPVWSKSLFTIFTTFINDI